MDIRFIVIEKFINKFKKCFTFPMMYGIMLYMGEVVLNA